jgi:hypothetical protein
MDDMTVGVCPTNTMRSGSRAGQRVDGMARKARRRFATQGPAAFFTAWPHRYSWCNGQHQQNLRIYLKKIKITRISYPFTARLR